MAKGEVKWFNNAKGWGFIIPEGGGDDIFVHFSSISGTGYKTLIPGQLVTYEQGNGDRGLHASNVVALNEVAEEEMA
ncbi:MAG: cold-shock protein [Legionella sp.]